ncbi:radical SAM family heme chaperone HemW [Ulvibacter litoralis]|uniref:Heme chaperone HemW n=1 Tax=Ulvibacter litoralis TaxID=227084 RepID=A0A1G7CN50_9FLAO|nr:radical SAM family heme chaperone HemW [Ulvibacter litoralis]GHC46931.1 coproporphyrinogen III oxidase [Ulvibacter litoralis]SDE40096.1 oxygen-independent coproporphyrinogen-3 oxidase [Ulvibacter litoralis]
MSGIYIHIPFCKQACHYCDFHFSTSLKKKTELVEALCRELVLRKEELPEAVQTIYFGGGTPSLLSSEELQRIFDTITENYTVTEHPEVTLEANPDDLTKEVIQELSESPINRLSIGVQSFFEADLKFMNRAHNAEEALSSIKEAMTHFDNISIDLIYGVPGMTLERWQENLNIAVSLNVPHISCYALTVEPKTALDMFIKKGIVAPVNDAEAASHYEYLLEATEKAGYENYEFSNFGKDGYYSQNNTAYWQGKSYLGIGPSAHSFDGKRRSWNVNNNTKYIKSIAENKLPSESEVLSETDKYNEYIMTGLRTKWGVSLEKIALQFGEKQRDYLLSQAKDHLRKNNLLLENNTLLVTKKGKFLSDGIASDLFLTNDF